MNNSFDVIIIGGGATGAGTARDCAMRGLKVLLVERNDIATGATGRNHGLLHSGARYAVGDIESATECIAENRILRKIAKHCVDPTSGLFISLPEDGLEYQDTFIKACKKAGIPTECISPAKALKIEPAANPALIGAVKVPDASIDPFRLTSANVIDAEYHGAKILTYTEVTEFIREGGDIVGIVAKDKTTGTCTNYYAKVTVNAAGIWGHLIAAKAGITVSMYPAKGSLLIFGHRVCGVVLNRCRKPSNADILVPGDYVSIIGTTSTRVGFDEIDSLKVTHDEVETLLKGGIELVPSLASTRIIRSYCGVRPLVASDDDPTGRNISRGIVLLDHQERDGVGGFITITGGKLMTYRLMAEMATDLVCRKIGCQVKGRTASTPLPGSEEKVKLKGHVIARKAAIVRHGTRHSSVNTEDINDAALVCECEEVSVGEVRYAAQDLGVRSLVDLRRRTRIGMGTCQGSLCACRASSLIASEGVYGADAARKDIASFMNERWKGMQSIAWGDTLREAVYSSWITREFCAIKNSSGNDKI